MKLKFKTNIMCAACVAKVTPHLDQAVGEGRWQADVTHKDRILTVEGATEQQVAQALTRAGYLIKGPAAE